MDKLIKAVTAAVLLTGGSLLYAGKNVAPAVAPVAAVEEPWGLYAGLGLLGSYFGRDCPCGGGVRIYDHTYGVTGLLGYDFNSFLGIQARLSWAPLESDFMKMGNGGLYLRPRYSLTDRLDVYGLLGYGWSRLSCDCPGHPHHHHNLHGFQWGVGGEYFFDNERIEGKRKGWSIWTDYVNLFHNKTRNNFTDNTWQLGVAYHF
ncbi:outer membrane beta-barrel protein [Nitratifractor salsuginis]|uniref:Outer membrane protein beta-barrel domain-containing protein n=1 Tax=Nitratifractor salsuginis (strain DSM 16511 / JCM 12458 / E9I37-1) TaxID=749222 RepID=E6WZT4_NITSE|nr:outer membrane beta-barrel protein [Nitratifractor salsuginis]ADV45592.1 hypothetical protein Nitsa_0321 [Nitratifractor salsuginis DSM 16511]ADV45595.1 hypothetical protein Nitsa_0324 [Nitratifractor salsuginis DSM 16511]